MLTAPLSRPDATECRYLDKRASHLGWQIQANLFCGFSLCCGKRRVTGRNVACMLQSKTSQLRCLQHIRRQLCCRRTPARCHIAYRMCDTFEVSIRLIQMHLWHKRASSIAGGHSTPPAVEMSSRPAQASFVAARRCSTSSPVSRHRIQTCTARCQSPSRCTALRALVCPAFIPTYF
jgi:hypothetical protein